MTPFRSARTRKGAAMVEMGLCLALFTPLVFGALRLAYGANQMHELADAVTAAAHAGGACVSLDEIRRVAVSRVPGLQPKDVKIVIERASDPALIHVSIENFRVTRLTGAEPLPQAPSSTFPYACE